MTLPISPPTSSENLQRQTLYFALTKATNTITYLWLIFLTMRFLEGALDWKLSTGCIIVSGAWLALTRVKVDHLLQTYF